MTFVLWALWGVIAVWGVSFAFVMAGFIVDTVRTMIVKRRPGAAAAAAGSIAPSV